MPPYLTSRGPLVPIRSMSYKSAGVDVEAGDALVDWLAESNKEPHQDKIISGIGGFAALFSGQFPHLKEPVLVSCTDGVGTKVKLAAHLDLPQAVAQDCVAMCVNDLICTGGDPLFFLDYYASGQLNLKAAKSFLSELRRSCHESDCALIGGETAEMPGVYAKNDFDVAGFCVGVVDRSKILGPEKVKKGDQVFALSSNGFHSNGFSLIRKVFAKEIEDKAPANLMQELLKPTHLYVQIVKKLKSLLKTETDLHAIAHITGGGIENVPRVLPKNLTWKRMAWEIPPLFREVQKRAQMTEDELLTTLNCGIGLVLIGESTLGDHLQSLAPQFGMRSFAVGSIEEIS